MRGYLVCASVDTQTQVFGRLFMQSSYIHTDGLSCCSLSVSVRACVYCILGDNGTEYLLHHSLSPANWRFKYN